jgi:1-acyl-sn-glycerol-3-phosphate acyltransferase
MIEQRQKVIEETGAYNPLIIFPEGCCTNNTALLPFKRGAFYGLN